MKKYLNNDEIKQTELNILVYFDGFCKKNNIRYSLAGGTLLGAVRHKGFIPWDDDIDVCMPRLDYEKFVKLYKNIPRERYILRENMPFIKLVDSNTRIDNKYTNADVADGLWIDIFPVDGLPADLNEVYKIYRAENFYRKLFMLGYAKYGRGKSLFKKIFKIPLIGLVKIIGNDYFKHKIEKIARKYDYNSSEYVGAITWGLYGVGEKMKKSEFERFIFLKFEGHKFPAFSCWDSYLKGLYKDYMKLPPIEKRKTHDMVAYYIDDKKDC